MEDMKKRVPEFRSEDREREFWATQDSTKHTDWSQAKPRKLANLKPSLRGLAERLEQERRGA